MVEMVAARDYAIAAARLRRKRGNPAEAALAAQNAWMPPLVAGVPGALTPPGSTPAGGSAAPRPRAARPWAAGDDPHRVPAYVGLVSITYANAFVRRR